MLSLSEMVGRVGDWVLRTIPFVAIGAWLGFQFMKFKNLKLVAKVMALEEREALDGNKKKIDETLGPKSDADIIDGAIGKGRKMPE